MVEDILKKKRSKVVLLGNEAVVRGALEAGVGYVSAYPGTPSSEIPITFSRIAKKLGIYFEYSTNEKTAFEGAGGASWAGVRSMTSQKHYGLNVASDSIGPLAFVGCKAGLVIVVADDPEGWSSGQSEQDTRFYARMFKIPTLEPSNPQECKDFTKLAFEISEEFEIPILLRITTKVSHSIGTVELGELLKPKAKGKFIKDPEKYFLLRPRFRVLHERLNEKISKIEQKYSKLNKVYGASKRGIITSGVSFEYAKEASQELKLNLSIAKMNLTHPLSHSFIEDFIKNKTEVVILEELEPLIERFVRQVAKNINHRLIIYGKEPVGCWWLDHEDVRGKQYKLPREGEYTLEQVKSFLLSKYGGKAGIDFVSHKKEVDKVRTKLPKRDPVLCAGCPHRSTFYAVKKVFPNAVYAGDVGCYILGILKPLEMQDFVISMGAGLGIVHGISKVSKQDLVAFVGDSTFFHAGLPVLVNCKFNQSKKSPLLVILDNRITAMTGHQPHPASGFTGMGEKVKPLKIEEIAKVFGAEVRVANSFNQKQLVEKLKELKEIRNKPRVLVSKGECRLLTKRKFRKKGIKIPRFQIDKNKCKQCNECTHVLACPAIVRKEDHLVINDTCLGCSVCSQICPQKAIKKE